MKRDNRFIEYISLMAEIGMFAFNRRRSRTLCTPNFKKYVETLFQCSTIPAIINMVLVEPLAVIEPLINLIDNEYIRVTAEIYFSGITINLIPFLIIGLLTLVGLLKLLGLYSLSEVGLKYPS